MFSSALLQKVFCHSEHLVENKKDENHMLQDLVNIVEGVEQISLNPLFFPVLFWLNVALFYYEEACFSCWYAWNVFLDFHTYVAAVGSISLYWAVLKLKMNDTAVITYSITFITLSSTFRVGYRDLFLSIHCFLPWTLS